MINGVVFQKKILNFNDIINDNVYTNYMNSIYYSGYKGIEGNNWYLNDKYSKTFDSFFSCIAEEAFYNKDFTGVLNDESIIRQYIELSQKDSIPYRILLCETERKCPSAMHIKWKNKTFIGYDYAYSGADYYSAVFNDVCLKESMYIRKLNEFERFRLNQNGLFQTLNEVKEFVEEREKVEKSGKDLEKGIFIIYKLYEVEPIDVDDNKKNVSHQVDKIIERNNVFFDMLKYKQIKVFPGHWQGGPHTHWQGYHIPFI